MKYILSLFVCAFFVAPVVTAQTDQKQEFNRNTVYVESYLLRHDFSDGFTSVNYERGFGAKNRLRMRVGAYPDFGKSYYKPEQSYPFLFEDNKGNWHYLSTLSFPITVTHILFPESNHHIEYGGGLVFRHEWYEHIDGEGNLKKGYTDIVAAMFPLMYRYQNDKGFNFRVGVNLFYSWPILPSPSFSVGYSF